MPRMTVYLDAEEYAHVKSRMPGYIRCLVRADMKPDPKPAKKLSSGVIGKKA